MIEDYWNRIIWNGEEEEDMGNLTLYSEVKEMESIEIEEKNIESAVRAIKIGKSGGTDGILGEFIKYGGEALRQALTGLFRKGRCLRIGTEVGLH